MIAKFPKKKPELMAPAGDWISLRAAVEAGCDAVYFGIQGLNMREGAGNFLPRDLPRITGFCAKKRVRAYLALNTLVYENETARVTSLVKRAKKAGVDAVICWDFSVIRTALAEKLPVFVSTQMSVANSESMLFFIKNFGVKRFILARECSLDDIGRIQRRLVKVMGPRAKEIEIEIFIHGAMCVSVSGRCLLSEFQFGKSANRGECLQPCRREYLVTDKDEGFSFRLGHDYILSPKDLCALPFIEKLIESGVSSFKIEGRQRNPEYVAAVVSAYRKAIDFYFENRRKKEFAREFGALKEQRMRELEKVYNKGFSSGFYLGKPIREWSGVYGNKATTRKKYVGVVLNYYKKPKAAEILVQDRGFRHGDLLMFQGPTTGVFSQKAESIERHHMPVQRAVRGARLAVRTERAVRRNDKIYRMEDVCA